jgi:putative membrane protein
MTGPSPTGSGEGGPAPVHNGDRPRTSNQLAEERTDLAVERSLLAWERTAMGYLRTSISLIGFGFSIPTFFYILKDVPGFEDLSATRPRILGLSLLILAVVMLVMAIVQQTTFLRRLSKESGRPFPVSVALLSSIVVLAIALSSMVMILMRIGSI